MRFQMPVHTMQRDLSGLGDESLGETLVELVKAAVPRRTAPTVATVARPERIDVIGLRPLVERHIPVHGFLAGLTRADVEPEVGNPRAVGVMGTVHVRNPNGDGQVPMAVVFLEWPDNRWWLWRALIDPTRWEVRDDTETRTRAIDGDPMPQGFGRWWSLGRRSNLKVTIRHGPQADSQLVH